MKVQYCYFGSVVINQHETLVETLHYIQNLILRFSYKHEIAGVFYYADHSFYHCIEGHPDVLQKLCDDLKKSNMLQSVIHMEVDHDLKESIYTNWSMRYVTKESTILKFFKERNFLKFQPLELNLNDQKKLIEVINAQYIVKKKVEYTKGYRVRGYSRSL